MPYRGRLRQRLDTVSTHYLLCVAPCDTPYILFVIEGGTSITLGAQVMNLFSHVEKCKIWFVVSIMPAII